MASKSSARGGASVTPSDSATIGRTRALYIGGAGDVAVRFSNGATATHASVPAGSTLMVEVDKVLSTGTTATNIVAWY